MTWQSHLPGALGPMLTGPNPHHSQPVPVSHSTLQHNIDKTAAAVTERLRAESVYCPDYCIHDSWEVLKDWAYSGIKCHLKGDHCQSLCFHVFCLNDQLPCRKDLGVQGDRIFLLQLKDLSFSCSEVKAWVAVVNCSSMLVSASPHAAFNPTMLSLADSASKLPLCMTHQNLYLGSSLKFTKTPELEMHGAAILAVCTASRCLQEKEERTSNSLVRRDEFL